MTGLQVEGLGLEGELHWRQRVGVGQQQVGGVGVEEVHEARHLEGSLAVADPAVSEVRAALELEGADAGVDDPGGAGVTAAIGHSPAVAQLLVDAKVDLRLAGVAVLEAARRVGVGRVGGAAGRHAAGEGLALGAPAGDRPQGMAVEGHRPRRPRERIGVEVPRRQLPGPLVVRSLGDVGARAVGVPVAVVLPRALVPVDQASRQGEADALASSRGGLVMMFTTPVRAFAPQTADAGPRTTSICLISPVEAGTRSHRIRPKKSR